MGLRRIAASVTVALVLSACSGGGGGDDPRPDGLLGEEPPAGAGGAGDPTTTDRPAATVQPTVPGGADASPTSTAVPPVADRDMPAPGTYSYETPDGDELVTLTVAGNDSVAFWDRRQGSELVRREIRVVGGALHVTREQRSDGSATGNECPWQPTLVLVGADLSPGASWTSEGSCSVDTDLGTFGRTRSIDGTVGDRTTVEIDGTTWEVVELTRTTVTTTTGPSVDITERLVEEVLWIPALALEARIIATQSATQAGAPVADGGYALALVSTRPT